MANAWVKFVCQGYDGKKIIQSVSQDVSVLSTQGFG